MDKLIRSLHHVTATVNDAQQDVEFYTKVLGLRLVKKTVNFDNHNVYHFYYGNEAGVAFELRDGNAERLPVRDASADAVIATLVLCSVAEVGAALREIRRVLKPGGRFVFIEHVAAPAATWRRRLQRWVRPLWRVIADGCHPDRDTLSAIRAAGFARVEVEQFQAPAGLVAPHIAGIAVQAG